jgi:hypothetical protein
MAVNQAQVTQTTANALAGSTIVVSGVEWLTAHSGLVTAGAVVITTVGSLIFSYLNKRIAERNSVIAERNAAANEARNKINERDITEAILRKVYSGMSEEEFKKVRKCLRK